MGRRLRLGGALRHRRVGAARRRGDGDRAHPARHAADARLAAPAVGPRLERRVGRPDQRRARCHDGRSGRAAPGLDGLRGRRGSGRAGQEARREPGHLGRAARGRRDLLVRGRALQRRTQRLHAPALHPAAAPPAGVGRRGSDPGRRPSTVARAGCPLAGPPAGDPPAGGGGTQDPRGLLVGRRGGAPASATELGLPWEGYDVVIEADSWGSFTSLEPAEPAAWEEAGATWWVESWWDVPQGPEGLAEVRRRVDAGPPQLS